ncbi:Protein CBG12921 [Caenorhabditis briggsae]|uniref:Protein CBG12921 n=1 Tax=Caenorhabditis briggsae TaxID=6238 RepID=A8XGP1_CAEBR|nr:Protein CBG12921 [Caenorhabditis briggsae]CAP31815.2 Protein CBG12921 [Caenorhabditis briggsae]
MVAIAAFSSSGQEKPAHNPKLGLFVYILASAAVIGGFLFGYDTSVVSAAMLYMPDAPGLKPMDTVWQEVLVSISPGMAAVGSLMSGTSSDYIGRRKVILGASAIFTIGALVCAASVNKIMLLVGRVLLGIVLEKVYNGDKEWVEYEMAEIIAFNEDQQKENEKTHSSGLVIWRILKTPHVLKACFIGSMLQAFQQLAGINTILYYTADIIRSSGISNNHTTIWISVALSVCNFIGPFIPMSLIERVGRRIIFLFSCGLVVLSLIFIGVAFLLVNHDSAATFPGNQYGTNFNSSYPDAKGCMAYTNCDFCVTTDACGFCHDANTKQGYCLPASSDNPEDYSSTGSCTSVNGSISNNFQWEKYYCDTKFTILPIIACGVYLLTFSSGFTSLPWVLNSEFYPMWARSTCVSISTTSNWVFNLIIALTYLSLTQVIGKYGAFWLYAGLTIIAFVFILFLVPETKGYSIEEVEMLFMNKKQRREAETRRRETVTEVRSRLNSTVSFGGQLQVHKY